MSPHPTELIELFERASQASRQAYNPYSRFSVGCALRTRSGRIYIGCNIENASYAVTLCAERVAACQAILHGDRDWTELIVVSPQAVSMCGVCRQFLAEFSPEMKVWSGYIESMENLCGPTRLADLLPSAMTLQHD
jgi:cytidine deaminase